MSTSGFQQFDKEPQPVSKWILCARLLGNILLLLGFFIGMILCVAVGVAIIWQLGYAISKLDDFNSNDTYNDLLGSFIIGLFEVTGVLFVVLIIYYVSRYCCLRRNSNNAAVSTNQPDPV